MSTVNDVPGESAARRSAVAVAAGKDHSLVLYANGLVLAFGSNEDGQCDVPAELSDVVEIAAGGFHNLALRNDGTVVAWGGNLFRQGEVPAIAQPVKSIAAGHWHNLALHTDGTVITWGRDRWGAMQVPEGLENVTAIDAGYEHSLALRDDGTVLAWGHNDKGQCNVPEGLNDVVAISAGAWQGFALTRTGEVIGWGQGENGQINVPRVPDLVAVSGGYWHGIALSETGCVIGWGDDEFNQNDVPLRVSTADVQAISAGGEHNLVLTTDGSVLAWGRDDKGQIQVPSHSPTRTSAKHSTQKIDVEASALPAGSIWGWGSTDHGLLGPVPELESAVPVRVPGIEQVSRAFLLENTVFALGPNGTVKGWGGNDKGQLCDGTATDAFTPRTLPSLREITTITRGPMAISRGGEVWSWAKHVKDAPAPVYPDALRAVSRIEHDNHTYYALLRDGTLRSWGRNQYGQIGNGTKSIYGKPDEDADLPTVVTVLEQKPSWLGKVREVERPLTDVIDIALSGGGGYHPISVYALRADGSVWGWGANRAGQLGEGSTEDATRPVRITALSGVVSLAAEPRTASNVWPWMYAITESGTVWRWRPSQDTVAIPELMADLSNIRSISIGDGCIAALTNDGTVWDWSIGALSVRRPALVAGLEGVTSVAPGTRSIALDHQGAVWIWGWEPTEHGRRYSTQADRVAGVTGATSICASQGSYIAVDSTGSIWAWGEGARGQLGSGDDRHRLTPAPVQEIGKANKIVAGHGTGFAIRADRSLSAWGENESNKLALTDEEMSGSIWDGLFALRDVVSIASGAGITVCATRDGSVWETGFANPDETRPLRVQQLTDVTAVAAGRLTKYALRGDGSVWAWGDGQRNEIGDGNVLVPGQSLSGMVSQRLTPTRTRVPLGSVAIAAGDNTAYALQQDGTVWSWGNNESGQLGNGAFREFTIYDTYDLLPAPVASLSDIVAICAGGSSAYALAGNGIVWAWGSNTFGQLGTGESATSSALPAQVEGVHDVRLIATSGESTFAVARTGEIWAWGRNAQGQLGDGTQIDRTSPVRVLDLDDVVAIACAGDATFALVSAHSPYESDPLQVRPSV